jgi:hypothetical protein
MLNSDTVVQELGREGILPFSRFWASGKPFNAPLAGLFEHWLVSVIIMLAPPPGDAYNFILKYPLFFYPCSTIFTDWRFQRYLVPTCNRQRFRCCSATLSLPTQFENCLVSTIPSLMASRSSFPAQQYIPCHCPFCATSQRPECLQKSPVLSTLCCRYGSHCCWRRILACMGGTFTTHWQI